MNPKFSIQKPGITNVLTGLILAILVVIGTFPENDWSYSIGIDPPLFWVFNHLFETGLNVGRHIIFPHGPLAFFMYPLSDNILLATLVSSLLKGLLVFNVFFLFNHSKTQVKWLAAFLFAWLISMVSDFNHLILANIILFYCNYYQSEKKVYKFSAFILTAFAFFVKAYVAIVSGTLFFGFVVYYFFETKRVKTLLFDGFSLLGFIVLFWLLMFGTLRGLLNFIWGMVHLAQDNSSAAAYYPENNWLVLAFFLLTLVVVFIFNKDKKSHFFVILIALSLFASWKHGIAREDIFHTKGFLIYIMICLGTFMLFIQKNYTKNIALSIFALLLFSVNMKNATDYYAYKYELFRVNNFVEFINDFDKLKEKAVRNSEQKTAQNRLPNNILDTISDSKVDIYPWDYSIAGTNNLNWQPRVVIQSYAAYTSWLDAQNAKFFMTEQAPDFLIWENHKTTVDVNNCDMNSLDNRYLLNDEPQTILPLMAYYDRSVSTDKFILYKKRQKPVAFIQTNIEKTESTLGEWIPVPDSNSQLIRAKLNFNKSLKQKLKSFLYKDEQFWIYLKLKDQSIHKYRIVPKNAVDGLWINPYIFDSETWFSVEQVMFKASNQAILSNKLSVEWEKVDFVDSPNRINNFFGFKNTTGDSLTFSDTNTFEQNESKYWGTISKEQLSEQSFEGAKSYHFKGNPYSTTFRFPLDSIPFGNLRITADSWVTSPNNKQVNDISMVLTVENKNGTRIYKRISLNEQMIDPEQWNNIFQSVEFSHQQEGSNLGVYFWNTGNDELLIDNFRVMIFTEKR